MDAYISLSEHATDESLSQEASLRISHSLTSTQHQFDFSTRHISMTILFLATGLRSAVTNFIAWKEPNVK
jgi:hypothetical protein